MRTFGRIDVGATPVELNADVKYAARFNLPDAGNVSKASVYLDGLGSGTGAQVARVVIYDAANVRVGVSEEVTVADGQAAGWVDFSFLGTKGKLALGVGDYFIAVHGGAFANTIRLFGSDPNGMGGKWNADTYSGGASDPFGAATTVTSDFAAFVTYFKPWVPPDETDLYFSRLPFAGAQKALGSGGPLSKSARPVVVGWHDSFTDPELGSNALVRDGSALAEMLGERVRITSHGTATPKVVYAYIHALLPSNADEDLSVTRLLYSRLSTLADDNVAAIVELIV